MSRLGLRQCMYKIIINTNADDKNRNMRKKSRHQGDFFFYLGLINLTYLLKSIYSADNEGAYIFIIQEEL
jgi:hypothetical protein